jgi:hypothetical protein
MPFINQARMYYEAEKDYYKGDTYLASLVVEWVRHKNQRDQVLGWNNLDDDVTDFYCFYYSNVAGLMAYGNLQMA